MTAATDKDRYPTLSAAGRQMLERLREHPAAPHYRHHSGNRLTMDDIAALHVHEQQALASPPVWPQGARPAWLDELVARVHAEVPFFRARGEPAAAFRQLPTVSRADLSADIARFVPDPLPLDRLITYTTTGTTGHPLRVPSHPQVAGRYLAFHKRAMRRFGIRPLHGRGQVGVMLLGFQRQCFTYVSVTPTMDESGLAKLNLHPDDWRDPGDRARYLDAMAPEFVSGDPISFTELLRLPTRMHPRALINVSMALSTGLRDQLEARFDCPVLDIYSMNEVGPIAVFDARVGGHVLLQDRLYVEILDAIGEPVAEGERGEITVSGGFNFCLPLLRYRTGDHAALVHRNGELVLVDLVGRAPVSFRHADGRWLNNVDVSHALAHVPLARYGLCQQADASLVLRLPPAGMPHASAVCTALRELLGELPLTVRPLLADDKIRQYESALPRPR